MAQNYDHGVQHCALHCSTVEVDHQTQEFVRDRARNSRHQVDVYKTHSPVQRWRQHQQALDIFEDINDLHYSENLQRHWTSPLANIMLFSKALQAVVLLMATTTLGAPAAEVNGESHPLSNFHKYLTPSTPQSTTDKVIPDLTKRACNCAAYSSCSDGCSAFGGTAGIQVSQGLCILSCADANGCGADEICCENGSSCYGYGCCAA